MLSIEFRRTPSRGGMACGTFCTKQAGMKCWFRVAGSTSRVQALELPVDMAALASHRRMRTCQREVREIVIKTRISPV